MDYTDLELELKDTPQFKSEDKGQKDSKDKKRKKYDSQNVVYKSGTQSDTKKLDIPFGESLRLNKTKPENYVSKFQNTTFGKSKGDVNNFEKNQGEHGVDYTELELEMKGRKSTKNTQLDDDDEKMKDFSKQIFNVTVAHGEDEMSTIETGQDYKDEGSSSVTSILSTAQEPKNDNNKVN